jgi:hypothetical protein
MKNKIFLAACLGLFYANSLAMNFKLFSGLNTSKYLFSSKITQIDQKKSTAVNIGFGISFQLEDLIFLEFNGIYGSGGAKTQISYSPNIQLAGIYRNTYLAIPIIIKYKLKPLATPYLGIGPELIYIFSHNLEIPEMEIKSNVLDTTKRFNLGLTLLAGYECKLKNMTLFGEIRYNRWFTNFFKDIIATVKSESWTFYIGLALKNHAD